MKWLWLIALCFIGCAEPDFAQGKGSEKFRVELFSNGTLVRSWVSVGSVGRKGGVYSFEDEATGKIVYVPGGEGTLVITSAEE